METTLEKGTRWREPRLQVTSQAAMALCLECLPITERTSNDSGKAVTQGSYRPPRTLFPHTEEAHSRCLFPFCC